MLPAGKERPHLFEGEEREAAAMFESPSHTIQNTNPCVDSGSPFQAANVYKASMEVKKKKKIKETETLPLITHTLRRRETNRSTALTRDVRPKNKHKRGREAEAGEGREDGRLWGRMRSIRDSERQVGSGQKVTMHKG